MYQINFIDHYITSCINAMILTYFHFYQDSTYASEEIWMFYCPYPLLIQIKVL
jgi:hypothetical protein